MTTPYYPEVLQWSVGRTIDSSQWPTKIYLYYLPSSATVEWNNWYSSNYTIRVQDSNLQMVDGEENLIMHRSGLIFTTCHSSRKQCSIVLFSRLTIQKILFHAVSSEQSWANIFLHLELNYIIKCYFVRRKKIISDKILVENNSKYRCFYVSS